MILAYFDESGTPEIPGTTSHYVLAALAIPVSKWGSCEKGVRLVKQKYQLTNAEIHTGWLMSPYLEQRKIQGFDQLDYAARKHEVRKFRNAELLRLQKENVKQYHRSKKNYIQTQDYIHLTYEERKGLVTELAALISSWSGVRLFAYCIDKLHIDTGRFQQPPAEMAFEQIISRFEYYLDIFSSNSGLL